MELCTFRLFMESHLSCNINSPSFNVSRIQRQTNTKLTPDAVVCSSDQDLPSGKEATQIRDHQSDMCVPIKSMPLHATHFVRTGANLSITILLNARTLC